MQWSAARAALPRGGRLAEALQRAMRGPRSLGSTYACLSDAHPHKVASATACSVLGASDATAQLISHHSSPPDGRPFSFDWQRWRALVIWGTAFYGGPCRHFYMLYDRWFGNAPLIKAAVDVFGNGAFIMVPSFYLTTGLPKGQTLAEAGRQLSEEWVTAASGTVAFWLPACSLNFAFVPPHSRILVVTAMSLMHKTWLSLLSNEGRVRARVRDTVETAQQGGAVLAP